MPPLPPLPPRPPDAHKGTFGTVLIVGGCAAHPPAPTMLGAPLLAARAALRAGTGLVRIAAPDRLLPHILAALPEATGLSLPTDAQGRLRPAFAARSLTLAALDATALLLGPGLALAAQRAACRALVRAALAASRPLVLDADGLNTLATLLTARATSASLRRTLLRRAAPLVLTPHPGEFARLALAAGLSSTLAKPVTAPQRRAAALALADALSAVVVLKGHRTVVASPGNASASSRLYINSTGNPALATGGTGDVLAGAIAAFIAQGARASDAATLAVAAHGRAADLWVQSHSPARPAGLLAHEVADLLPAALSSLSRRR